MKVVVCQNCGAKYQLNDTEDINAFECSVCTGSLKELESFPSGESDDFYNYEVDSNSVLVYCKNCGLKFNLDKDDNIDDFECVSCEGPLDYVSDSDRDYYSNNVYGFEDEIIPEHAMYGERDSNVQDEIIPVHAEKNLNDDEIIPVHAESSYESNETSSISSNLEDSQNYSSNDDYDGSQNYQEHKVPYLNQEGVLVVPEDYDESQYNEPKAYVNQEGVYVVEDSSRLSSDETISAPEEYFGVDEIIPAHAEGYSGVDEIIPIHAEGRNNHSNSTRSSGFEYNPNFNSVSEVQSGNESDLVEVTDIPDDVLASGPKNLSRQFLSEEDRLRFERNKNEMVFNSTEEYEEYKLARYKYYEALKDILKDEFLNSLDIELYGDNSVVRLIKKGNDAVRHKNGNSDESNSLVSQDTIEMMNSSPNVYEPKKSYADIYILIGLFLFVVGLAYYFFVLNSLYVLILIFVGIIILALGFYQRYRFEDYRARGRIIREKLLTLPPDFEVFYAVQPPGSADIINHVVVGPTGVFTILSKRYNAKEHKDKMKSDSETEGLVNESASIQDYIDKKNTLELQDGYEDNQTRFQFGNEEIHFLDNSAIKHKALELSEDLAIFLDRNGLSGIYIEPLLGFINNNIAVLNVILTNEDLFMDELFNKMIYGRRRLDNLTIAKISKLLSLYSADCSI